MTTSCIDDLRRQVFSLDSDDLDHIWLRQPGLIRFLDGQTEADKRIVLFAFLRDSEDRNIGSGRLRVWTVLVPRRTLASIDTADLDKWNNPYDCGMWQLRGDKEHPAAVERDYFKLGGRPLTDGQPLVFPRTFKGREVDKRYCEVAQRLLHAHRLHWTPERRAWCRFDKAADVEDVISWYESGESACVTIDRETLERYMAATNTVLIQMFDSVLLPSSDERGPITDQVKDKVASQEVERYYRRSVTRSGSCYYGIQILTSRFSAGDLGRKMDGERHLAEKKYETFVIGNIEGEAKGEASCDPRCLSNSYDTTSTKPQGLSPVFFNPRVLDKYKSDPDKYRVTSRQIYCREAMLLQTYHTNEANQVVTYIYYLGLLPYKEQLYWKSFNENPKVGISKEAVCTDFKGRPYKGPDALRDLRLVVKRQLTHVEWYKPVSSDLLDQLSLPTSGAKKQWNDTIGLLNKIVNERLDKSFFLRESGRCRTTDNEKWGSIRWMKEALKACGDTEKRVREVTQPFFNLQELRTHLYAHDIGSGKAQKYESLIREYGSPRGHVEHLCQQLVNSLRYLLKRWPADSGE